MTFHIIIIYIQIRRHLINHCMSVNYRWLGMKGGVEYPVKKYGLINLHSIPNDWVSLNVQDPLRVPWIQMRKSHPIQHAKPYKSKNYYWVDIVFDLVQYQRLEPAWWWEPRNTYQERIYNCI